MNVFTKYESEVRAYCRNYPNVFHQAKGSILYTESGKEYIDFLAGAGALNYGHNNQFIQEELIAYLKENYICHGLDLYTVAKRTFIQDFVEKILQPKDLDYKLQFPGPTGTNAVEAALKLARKVKKRDNIFAFMGGFHGMTLGSLAATSNLAKREGAGLSLNNVTFIPYPNRFKQNIDTIDYLENILTDSHSGISKPAAIILETLQAEGGVHIAPTPWLKKLSKLCEKRDILLICDDIQVGCNRTGPFFSFERAGIKPDIVTLSKSISGYGIPMSLVLFKKELDIWQPAEHNGTFRGNQLAFVGGSAALTLKEEINLRQIVKENETIIGDYLKNEIAPLNDKIQIRGLGSIWGIDFSELNDNNLTKKIITKCYEKGLIIETAGRNDSVIKILPPLTIKIEILNRGLSILKDAIVKCK